MENENIVANSAVKNDELAAQRRRNNRKRQKRKLGWLFTLTGITALVLIVETYAWFVGMRTAKVSSFDVEIAAVDSLMLSTFFV